MGQLILRRRLGDSSSPWATVAFGGTQPGVFSTTNSADASRSMIHMFEECSGPVLVIYCTQTGWPVGLERELDELARRKPKLLIRRLVASHTAPVWRESVATATLIRQFLDAA